MKPCCLVTVVTLLLLRPALSCADEKPAAKDAKPKFTNRLARETSPYLLLHAHNPVDWFPWGPEAFDKAKKENKLIFLSIGYSSCYWCHVMERQSFNNPEIAKQMNERFVCIKVDREERPDVDHIYMTALHVQGSRGGWPLSMFLLPDGKPIGGGTYWPPEDREEEGKKYFGFKSILKLVHDDWQRQPDKMKERAVEVAAAVSTEVAQVAGAGKRVPILTLNRELLADALNEVKDSYDSEHGGFGSKRGPKFPQPVMAELLLTACQQKRDDALLTMVTHTLDRMARGGIYDHLGGGFHRYSTDREWKVPHFEKMLYDNAQLVSLYSRAHTLTKDPSYRRVVEETLEFVAGEMTAPQGVFYSALDAETDAEEGKYYVWTAPEIDKALTPADAALFKRVYGVTAPNFEEKYNVLLLPQRVAEVAADLKMTDEDLLAKLQPMKKKLSDVRSQRERPLLDTKVLTGWNGLMIAGCADAAMAFKNPAYAGTGEKAANFLLKNLKGPDGRLLRTCTIDKDGRVDAKLNAYLEDYAFLIHGLLGLHDATGKQQWLDEARTLTNAMLEHYGDKEAGGFFFTSHDHEKLFARAKDQYDGATPSGNSIAALSLVRLAPKTNEPRYAQEAERTFKAFAETLKTSPSSSTAMYRALALWLDDKDKGPKTLDNPFRGDEEPAKAPEPVKVSGSITSHKVGDDGKAAVSLTVTLEIEKGWHAYANPAGSDNLIPTTIEIKAANKLEDVKISYPAGKERKEEGVDETIRVYEGKVSIPITLTRPPVEGKTDTSPLEVSVKYQACSESKCLPPKTVKLKVEGK